MSRCASHYQISQLIFWVFQESGLKRSHFAAGLGYRDITGGLRSLDAWLMAPGAIVVVEFSAFGLLRVESEFGVGLAALGIAASKRKKRKYHHGDTEARKNPVQKGHDDWGIACKNRRRGRIIRKP